MTKTFKNRRRRFLVNRKLQYGLLWTSFFHVFLFFAIIGLRLFTPLFIQLGKSKSTAEMQQAANVLLYLHANFWPAVLLSFFLIALLSLRASHRIAGPLYRIKLILNSVQNGMLPRPGSYRKGDNLVEEMTAANEMLEKLRAQVTEIRAAQTRLHEAVAACSGMVGKAGTAEIIECMNDLRERERQCADKIAFFRVE